MLRVGFVGTENSHVKHFIRFLNVESRHPGYRAQALAAGLASDDQALAEYGGIDTIVKSPSDLIGEVDMAIVCNRDGRLHRRVAEPLLRSGMPVLVDKPLATTVDDAQALLYAGATPGARLFSASALRFVPEMPSLLEAVGQGPLRHLHLVGAADPDSEHAGLFFYGIHTVEAALEILGNPVIPPEDVEVCTRRIGGTIVAQTRVDDVEVTLTFVAPLESRRVPFHATAVRETGVVARELTLDDDYNAPALDAFLNQTKPLTSEQLLTPIVLLDAIVRSIGQ